MTCFDSMRTACAGKPHGTRQRYVSGCRCGPCRSANSRYECERARARAAGDWNGYVSAGAARDHVLALGEQGIGYKSVAAAADVATSIVAKIRSGDREQIRRRTERRILAVDQAAVADGALVDARPGWKKIRDLLSRGFTRVQLAEWIGNKGSLQLGRQRMTARSASRVERMVRLLEAGKLRRTR
jgi:hypothetical protein